MEGLTYEQLAEINDSLEEYLFKQPLQGSEPFAPTYKKDPRHFRQLIRLLISFKRDLMKVFNGMYADRWNLINYHTIPQGHVLMDETADYSQYYNDYYWNQYQAQLAQTIEQNKKKSYDLGILGLLLLLKIPTLHTSADIEEQLLKQSQLSAQLMMDVTKKRIAKQIQTSLSLGEDRTAFEKRIKDVLQNQYRGRITAQYEGVQSYLDAQRNVANDGGYTRKTWTGSQSNGAEICGQVIGNTVPIGSNFANGLDGPLAHIGCLCSLEYS